MSTLRDWHDQAQAEYQDYFGREIVSTYGRLPMEYASLFRSAGVMDMGQRGVVRVAGEDRLAFLNSLLTAELVSRDGSRRLTAGEVSGAFLLDGKGRIQGEMRVMETGAECLLEMDRRLVAAMVKELEKYHFREKVSIVADETVSVLGVFGSAAAKVLGGVLGTAVVGLPSGRSIALGGQVVWRDDLGDAPALGVIVPAGQVPTTWEKLLDAPEKPVAMGWAAYNAARVEARRGVLGIDYDGSFLPGETGQLERMVSFSKGCYPGQEIVARMQSREQCVRRVVGLRMEGGEMPLAGEKVYAAEGGSEIGAITSSTISPRQSGVALCLAIVKKPSFEPGTKVKVPAEGALREAVVL